MKNLAFASALLASLGAAALPAIAQDAGGSFTSTQSAGYADLTRSPLPSEVIVDEASVAPRSGYDAVVEHSAAQPRQDALGSFTSTRNSGYVDPTASPVGGAVVVERSVGPRQIGGSFTGGDR